MADIDDAQHSPKITLSISNIDDLQRITQDLERDPSKAGIVTSITIDLPDPQEETEDEALVEQLRRQITEATQTISSLLTTCFKAGSTLTQFIWPNCHIKDRDHSLILGVLQSHYATLEKLSLGFAPRELNKYPPLVESISFPSLVSLTIDAGNAHGDSGLLISTILSKSPNLECLDFEWPGCDLYTCQIQDIVWDKYHFSRLKVLKADGWDFDRHGFNAFLLRCRELEEFEDGTEYNDGTEYEEDEPRGLGSDELPKLGVLTVKKSDRFIRLQDWFPRNDARGSRRIRQLVLTRRWQMGSENLSSLADVPIDRQVLCLEFRLDLEYMWPTPFEPVSFDSDSDSGSEVSEVAEEIQEKENESHPCVPSKYTKQLSVVLPRLCQLEELALPCPIEEDALVSLPVYLVQPYRSQPPLSFTQDVTSMADVTKHGVESLLSTLLNPPSTNPSLRTLRLIDNSDKPHKVFKAARRLLEQPGFYLRLPASLLFLVVQSGEVRESYTLVGVKNTDDEPVKRAIFSM